MNKIYSLVLVLALFNSNTSEAGLFRSLMEVPGQCYNVVRAQKKRIAVGIGAVCTIGVGGCVIVEQAGIQANSVTSQ